MSLIALPARDATLQQLHAAVWNELPTRCTRTDEVKGKQVQYLLQQTPKAFMPHRWFTLVNLRSEDCWMILHEVLDYQTEKGYVSLDVKNDEF